MKLGVITTSRADFGIYFPLLKAFKAEKWPFLIFAGGMHTSPRFGNTVDLIEKEYNIPVAEKVVSLVDDDSPEGITESMGVTTEKFGKLWSRYKDELDLVFVLGDRYEMFSAAASLLPFNIPIAHLHGGETTLGAIDNKFRHALSAISDFHFASTQTHAEKVSAITGDNSHVYNVGALGVDGIKTTSFFSPEEFLEKFHFDVMQPFVLVTYHPETVDLRNVEFIHELTTALLRIPYRVLCTLPNADTQGAAVRAHLLSIEKQNPKKFQCYENLGQRGYLSAMKYCTMMIGNTSSGIVEAASFDKPVVNVGNRQKGRTAGDNVIHCSNNADEILSAVKYAETNMLGKTFNNPYGDGQAAVKIINILKSIN